MVSFNSLKQWLPIGERQIAELNKYWDDKIFSLRHASAWDGMWGLAKEAPARWSHVCVVWLTRAEWIPPKVDRPLFEMLASRASRWKALHYDDQPAHDSEIRDGVYQHWEAEYRNGYETGWNIHVPSALSNVPPRRFTADQLEWLCDHSSLNTRKEDDMAQYVLILATWWRKDIEVSDDNGKLAVKRPVRTRVWTALYTNDVTSLRVVTSGDVSALLDAAGGNDERIAKCSREALRNLKDEKAKDSLLRAALDNRDEEALNAVFDADYTTPWLTAATEFLNQQWSQYRSCDPDFANLSTAYQKASERGKARIVEAAMAATFFDFSDIVRNGFDSDKKVPDKEWRRSTEVLLHHGDPQRLWRFSQVVPLKWGIRCLRELRSTVTPDTDVVAFEQVMRRVSQFPSRFVGIPKFRSKEFDDFCGKPLSTLTERNLSRIGGVLQNRTHSLNENDRAALELLTLLATFQNRDIQIDSGIQSEAGNASTEIELKE